MKTIEINKEEINSFSNTLSEVIFYSISEKRFRDLFSTFLESSIDVSNFKSRNERLEIIKFLDKINRFKELELIENNQIKMDDLKALAERFGAKAQSSFSTNIDIVK